MSKNLVWEMEGSSSARWIDDVFGMKDENRKMWKLKDVKIVAAEISLMNSVPVRIKFSRVLTLSKTRPSSDVCNYENA